MKILFKSWITFKKGLLAKNKTKNKNPTVLKRTTQILSGEVSLVILQVLCSLCLSRRIAKES